MSVERYDLDKCIGCRECINICPMDVFRFDEAENKSIIAYPENCQCCGMCYYGCLGQSLQIALNSHMFPVVGFNATSGIDMNHFVFAQPGLTNVQERLSKTGYYESETKHTAEE